MKDNNNHTDQPTGKQPSFYGYKSKFRKISQEEIKQILKNHGEKGKQANLSKVRFLNIGLSENNPQKAIFLQEHEKWLETDGKEGKRADLESVNLQEADFRGANLQQADLNEANLQKADLGETDLQEAYLEGANLQEADLRKANLQKAILTKANLQEAHLIKANLQMARLGEANLQEAELRETNLQLANLTEANLKGAIFYKADMQSIILDDVKNLSEANLSYANFQGATDLLGNEFAQADVTGTKLPDDIIEFKALETVEKTSQNARKIFFAMLLGCVYSWLTIATTTDVRLLTNTASSPLPIIGTEIPIAWFYIAAPLVLICLYFYFHLYLLKLWEALASLPAIFPDGKRLDERAYPWLLNGLVRRYFKRLKDGRPFIAHMQEWITIFLAWWVVPVTMMTFWLRYIPRHDWIGTIFHIGLIVVSVAFAIIFYRLYALTLQGKKKVDFRLKISWKDRRFFQGVTVVLIGILFSLLSYGAIEGNFRATINSASIKDVVPWAFRKIGYDVFVDFQEKIVSEVPANYGLIPKEERFAFINGANLKRRNLNKSNMSDAFLVKADLRNALLKNAYLERTNLQLSNLKEAKLEYSYLGGANLQKANLRFADLKHATLVNANLQQTDFLGANLQEASLDNANLQQAVLNGANLQQANFSDADLKNADLGYAYVIEAKNLTINQLSKVKTLYKAKLDPHLLEQVKKCCPHLLEEPKEETDQTK